MNGLPTVQRLSTSLGYEPPTVRQKYNGWPRKCFMLPPYRSAHRTFSRSFLLPRKSHAEFLARVFIMRESAMCILVLFDPTSGAGRGERFPLAGLVEVVRFFSLSCGDSVPTCGCTGPLLLCRGWQEGEAVSRYTNRKGACASEPSRNRTREMPPRRLLQGSVLRPPKDTHFFSSEGTTCWTTQVPPV